MQRILILILSLALVGGCSLFRPHRVDINQGNVIEQEQIDLLELGMTKRQVQFVMGTPLLADPFHLQRWDYVYSIKEGYNPRVQRHVALFFEGDFLDRLEGQLEPAAAETMVAASEAEAERTRRITRVMEELNR